MRIGVPRETAHGERRVGLVPDGVAKLRKIGLDVVVEHGAGAAAFFPDAAYAAAGAELSDANGVLGGSDVIVKVQPPALAEVGTLRSGSTLISLIPSGTDEVLDALGGRRVSVLALEKVPRITRAQSMDILSSQATVAGYKAVLIAAAESPRLLPMLTTAAGSIPPAKGFVIGAGVAGLMAIATLRRLGASVSGFDIRAAAREQVLSLGATFVGPEPQADAETAGGYARQQTEEERAATLQALADHLKDQDVVVTTAQIPGRPAPRLISRAMVSTMKQGSVIVDMAAETGGNCEATVAGEVVTVDGVAVVGATNLAGSIPHHASLMFSRNVLTLLQHMTADGSVVIKLDDEIVGPMCISHDGARR